MIKRILLIILVLATIAGCSTAKKNPWKDYEGLSSEKIFHQGERNLAKKKYTQAVKDFEALDALYPFGPYAQQGQLDIIYAYYKNGDNPSGLAAADRYIRLYPRSPYIDYVYYMKGRMSFEEGFTWLQKTLKVDEAPHDLSSKRESFAAFNQIVTIYPHSIYATDSALRMAYIRNMIARKEVLLADFYYKRKAYVAAANRASEVVQHYSQSTSVPHALAVLVKSYRAMGLPDQASKTYRILQASYPQSQDYKDLSGK